MDELTVEGLIEWHEEQCGHMRDTLDDIEVHWIAKRAATERLAFHTNAVELLKKQKAENEGAIYYHDEEWEFTHHDVTPVLEAADEVGDVGPVEVQRLRRISSEWWAKLPTDLDEDGCIVDRDWQRFDTEEAARSSLNDPTHD